MVFCYFLHITCIFALTTCLYTMSQNQEVSEHYNKVKSIGLSDRQNSKIINIRNINNFIKSVLIQRYAKKDISVLDLGCGKGGDIRKYIKQQVKTYYGIDIAEKSIEEARQRLRNLNTNLHARFEVRDAYATSFDLQQKFDLIASQFSFHYAFCSQKSFETSVKNISSHLQIGGHFIATIPNIYTLLRRYKNYGNGFGNDYYKVHFDDKYEDILKKECKFGIAYKFTLAEAVDDCKEYLIPHNILTEECKENGMELIEHVSFMDFYNKNYLRYKEMHDRMVKQKLNIEEQKVLELYSVIVYKKTK